VHKVTVQKIKMQYVNKCDNCDWIIQRYFYRLDARHPEPYMKTSCPK